MFERYTEKARRVVFFARYEASQFGSPYIETEHILLGLLREDKALTNRFLRSHASVELIRKQIEGHTTIREKVSTSVDLPLSNEGKRVLAYAADEAERLAHKHIGTEHLLLGLLREEKCFAAEILQQRGLRLSAIREELARASQVKSQAPLRDREFSWRTSWNLTPNRYTEALDAHRKAGREVLDLTASNPTTIGLRYREEELLRALAHREALIYRAAAEGAVVRARGGCRLLRRAGKHHLPRRSHPDHQHQRGLFVRLPPAVRSGGRGAGAGAQLPAVRLPRRHSGCEAGALRTGLRPRLADRLHIRCRRESRTREPPMRRAAPCWWYIPTTQLAPT